MGPADDVTVDITDNPAASRYELRHDSELVGVVEYYPQGEGVLVIRHVEVLRRLRGRGHSEPFLQHVLEAVDARGLKVIPICSYAAAHLRSHPELSHLLD
jgi:predicted GNAT family acetyltransferase